MNIVDEMRIRGGLPTEAELRFENEMIRRARERAAPRPPWIERLRSFVASWRRRLTGRVARPAPGRTRTS